MRRRRTVRPLHGALGLMTAFAAGFGALEIGLFATGPVTPRWAIILFPAVALAWIAAGALASWRRPTNRTGALLCFGGLTMLVASLETTQVPALIATGKVLATLPLAALLHALLAFPSGRAPDRASRVLVVAGYAVVFLFHAPTWLLAPAPLVSVADVPEVVDVVDPLGRIAFSTVVTLSAVVLARRLRDAAPAQRRVLGLVSGYAVLALLLVEAIPNLIAPLAGWGAVTVFVGQVVTIAGVPLAFAAVLVRGGFARMGEVDELAAWLATPDDERPTLRDAVAGALGDPSVQLLYWLGSGYATPDGTPAELPAGATVEIDLDGRRVGAIAYDGELIADPEVVRATGRVLALAMDRERLTAELLASRDSLRESRARIADEGDRERRRIARDLHDGLQAQLVALAMQAGALGPAGAGVRDGVERAIDELRGLVHGVMPALLIERGLYAAVEELVDRMPLRTGLEMRGDDRRLSQPVESAGYFVVAEALANAVKHAEANELSVSLVRDDAQLRIEVRDDGVGGARVDRGSGLRGIGDRLDVLGGRLQLESRRGAGTRVLAEVPCA